MKRARRSTCLGRLPIGCERLLDETVASCEEAVEAYIRRHRKKAADEFGYFRRCPSLATAIRFAALCMLPDGQRHPHQYRIPREVLGQAEHGLQACHAELIRCRRFEDVLRLVERELLEIRGIGVLTAYDIATRLAAHLGIEPGRVYLHAGTAAGARALGLNYRSKYLELRDLPVAFARLRPREIEDCLCLYKSQLASHAA